MDLLIKQINELQDICTYNNINHTLDLPQIVVIGSQSSGKSSVLENIVGRDFLPRGTGIVTRRPLIIQLIYTNDTDIDFCVFNHNLSTKFTDFEAVKQEIIDETNREIKAKNDVSSKPITLKIYSKTVITLTLVDLPGLVKVPTADQPLNICTRSNDLCKKYIKNKNAIILAVSAANSDITTSDALQLAREVDPTYDRTIGVLTKIDLMDKGTNVIHILSMKVIKVRFGFIPLVNRSQNDIEEGKTIKEALKFEKEYFANHLSYKNKAIYCGTPYLIEKLNMILHEHIKLCVPELREKVEVLTMKKENELKKLGSVNLPPKDTVLKIITEVSHNFKDILNGNIDNCTDEIVGGARLNFAFYHSFEGYLNNLKPLEKMKDEEIRYIYYNSGGSCSLNVFKSKCFERLTKKEIEKLTPHVKKLVNIAYNELVRISKQACDLTILTRFPALREKILSCLKTIFIKRKDDTLHVVGLFMDWNATYINTRDSELFKWNELKNDEQELSIEPKPNKNIIFDSVPEKLIMRGDLTTLESFEINELKCMINAYFNSTRKVITDQVPKAIMNELVYKSEEKILETLLQEVYNMEDIENLVTESEKIVEKRSRIKKELIALKQAYELICSI